MSVRSSRDFWAGAIYLGLGLSVVVLGRGYSMGSSARMGPGYFPTILGGILAVFGAIAVARAFIRPGDGVSAIAWKPLSLILGATVLYGLLLERAGLIVALPLLMIVSAMASRHTQANATSLLALVGILAFCALVFVKGLGVPMPLLGTWFSS